MIKTLQIKQRRVVYLMGFDPRGSNFYHQLLRQEVLQSKQRGTTSLTVSELEQGELFSQCHWQQQDGPGGDYRFSEMRDVVMPYFRPKLGMTWWWWLCLTRVLFSSSALWRQHGQSVYFQCLLLYPVVILGTLLLLCCFLAFLIAGMLQQEWLGFVLTPLLLLGLELLLGWLDNKVYLRYLLGVFLFIHQILAANSQPLEQLLERWTLQLADDIRALPSDAELLIVGHSCGGLLAVRLAQRLRQQLTAKDADKWSLLTMGSQSSYGLASWAEPFQQSIAELTNAPDLRWMDVSAPQDIVCSGNFDAGILPGAIPGKIRLRSARFKDALEPAEYRRNLLKFFHLHLQYLRGSSTGIGFDYLQLLAQATKAFDYKQR